MNRLSHGGRRFGKGGIRGVAAAPPGADPGIRAETGGGPFVPGRPRPRGRHHDSRRPGVLAARPAPVRGRPLGAGGHRHVPTAATPRRAGGRTGSRSTGSAWSGSAIRNKVRPCPASSAGRPGRCASAGRLTTTSWSPTSASPATTPNCTRWRAHTASWTWAATTARSSTSSASTVARLSEGIPSVLGDSTFRWPAVSWRNSPRPGRLKCPPPPGRAPPGRAASRSRSRTRFAGWCRRASGSRTSTS